MGSMLPYMAAPWILWIIHPYPYVLIDGPGSHCSNHRWLAGDETRGNWDCGHSAATCKTKSKAGAVRGEKGALCISVLRYACSMHAQCMLTSWIQLNSLSNCSTFWLLLSRVAVRELPDNAILVLRWNPKWWQKHLRIYPKRLMKRVQKSHQKLSVRRTEFLAAELGFLYHATRSSEDKMLRLDFSVVQTIGGVVNREEREREKEVLAESLRYYQSAECFSERKRGRRNLKLPLNGHEQSEKQRRPAVFCGEMYLEGWTEMISSLLRQRMP